MRPIRNVIFQRKLLGGEKEYLTSLSTPNSSFQGVLAMREREVYLIV